MVFNEGRVRRASRGVKGTTVIYSTSLHWTRVISTHPTPYIRYKSFVSTNRFAFPSALFDTILFILTSIDSILLVRAVVYMSAGRHVGTAPAAQRLRV